MIQAAFIDMENMFDLLKEDVEVRYSSLEYIPSLMIGFILMFGVSLLTYVILISVSVCDFDQCSCM